MDTETVIAWTGRYLMQTYRRAPVAFVEGNGVRIRDADGREYLDFVAGIAVNSLGHNHPRLVQAVQEQAARLLHCSNLYHIPPQAEVAKLLVEHSPFDRAFFCNSGAEANEAAIKLARKFARIHHGPERYGIITATNSFHGRTLATLAATGQEKYRKGFEPLPPGFKEVPFNDLKALEEAVDGSTCAVLLEPIQGEGGVIPATREYLQGARALCNREGLLLILDEVQTGIGRTGKLFAFEHYGVIPDIVTLAKGLGGGVPIGAVLAKEAVAAAFHPGDHGSTFGGNPLSCAASLAVLRTILEDGLLEHVATTGEYLLRRLRELQERSQVVLDVRGIGLMVAVELAVDAAPVVEACMTRGLLVNPVQPKVLRLVPPLIVTREDVDEAVEILGAVLCEIQ